MHLSPLFVPASSIAGLLVCHASCNTERYNASLLRSERHQQANARAGEVNKGGNRQARDDGRTCLDDCASREILLPADVRWWRVSPRTGRITLSRFDAPPKRYKPCALLLLAAQMRRRQLVVRHNHKIPTWRNKCDNAPCARESSLR